MKSVQSALAIAGIMLAGTMLACTSVALARQTDGLSDEKAIKAELAKLQGEWELILKFGNRTIRTTKLVEGNRTTVTRYDENGAIVSRHQSEFSLEITAEIKIFRYSKIDKATGRKKETISSYIYTVDDSQWVEARGLMKENANEPPNLFVWKRVRK